MAKGEGKFSVTFTGFDTMKQAKAFLDWYEGQGEQDSGEWLEYHSNLVGAYVDVHTAYVETETNISANLELFYKEEGDAEEEE